MIRWLISALGYLLLTCAALAQVGQIPTWPPKQFIASGGGYTGPLDVISGALFIVSVRCAKSSYTGNVMDVWDAATGSTTETLITCSSGGVLNTSSPTALATTCATACNVKTLYDQSGLTSCTGGTAACDFTQATNANRPALLNFATPASWLVSFVSANSNALNAPGLIGTAPYPMTLVENRTLNFTGFGRVIADSNGFVGLLGAGSANTMKFGSGGNFAISDSVLHSLQFNYANGASGLNVIDGVATTYSNGSAGTNGLQNLGNANGGNFGDYNVTEYAIYPTGTWTPTQYGNMCHNQRLYFGTPGSC